MGDSIVIYVRSAACGPVTQKDDSLGPHATPVIQSIGAGKPSASLPRLVSAPLGFLWLFYVQPFGAPADGKMMVNNRIAFVSWVSISRVVATVPVLRGLP